MIEIGSASELRMNLRRDLSHLQGGNSGGGAFVEQKGFALAIKYFGFNEWSALS